MSALTTEGVVLPPDLQLIAPHEPLEPFLADAMKRERRPEALLRYGRFVVTLLCIDQPASGRLSMMPTADDLGNLYDCGYGVPPSRIMQKYLGRIVGFQRDLGFYPKGYVPPIRELFKRYEWIASQALPREEQTSNQKRSLEYVLRWAAQRSLAPSPPKVYDALRGDSLPLVRIFNTWRRPQKLSRQELLAFGARVLADHGGPITKDELRANYATEVKSSPHTAIINHFGSYINFWREFDYLSASTSGQLSASDVLGFGTRLAIAKGNAEITAADIDTLSHQHRFPSRHLIMDYFKGGVPEYRQVVNEAYSRYLDMVKNFERQGVTPAVCRAMSARYEDTADFKQALQDNIEVLRSLSRETRESQYVLRIITSGFNLLDTKIMDWQIEDLQRYLKKMGIHDSAQLDFIYRKIPRFAPNKDTTS